MKEKIKHPRFKKYTYPDGFIDWEKEKLTPAQKEASEYLNKISSKLDQYETYVECEFQDEKGNPEIRTISKSQFIKEFGIESWKQTFEEDEEY